MNRRVDEYSLKFIQEREPTHKVMMEQVGRMEQYAGVNSTERIWFNYRMMQVFDRISLFFCANFDIASVPETGAHSEGKGYYGPVINPTPVRFGMEDGEVRLRAVDKATVVADPYPFDQSPLTVGVRGRIIPRVAYKNQEEFREVYSKTPRELFEFKLTAA
jgi:hypothetical protein